jgi:hypothetical protein
METWHAIATQTLDHLAIEAGVVLFVGFDFFPGARPYVSRHYAYNQHEL